MASHCHIFIVVKTIANYDNAMVNFIVIFRAAEVIFRDDAFNVVLKAACRVDGSSNWVLEKFFLDFIIIHHVLFFLTSIFEVKFFCLLALVYMWTIWMCILAS